jgi:hypothetical protein
MLTARGYAGAALAGGKIYVIGGYNGKEALAVNEGYLPDRDGSGETPWVEGAPLPEGRYAMGVVSVADLIQVIGGEVEGSGAYTLLTYNPQGDLWQQIEAPKLTQPWSHMGLVSLTTQVYSIGGKVDVTPSAQNLAYQAVFTVAIPLVR